MPKRPEPTFGLKQIIWDVAATVGTDNWSAVYREIDLKIRQFHKNDELIGEVIPDERTVRSIIEVDINSLLPEVVVSKLPQHVWHLRNDYEAIKQLAESVKAQQEAPTEAVINQKLYEETPHKQKIRELADELRNEISSPKILYIEKISTKLSIDGKGELDHLYQGLRCHLETGGFSEVLTEISNWKKGMKKYLKYSHDLLTTAQSGIKGQSKIPDDEIERNERTGYKLSFFKAACDDAIEIRIIADRLEMEATSKEYTSTSVAGNPPVTQSGYYRSPLTNNLWLLGRYDAGDIYVGRNSEELEICESMHRDLADKLSKPDHAKKVAKLHKNLQETSDHIKQQLQKFTDMEHLPGHCELCS